MIGSANLNIMIKAARRAGRSLVKDFREVENLQVSMKGAGDFVSRADTAAEEIIKEDAAIMLDTKVDHLCPITDHKIKAARLSLKKAARRAEETKARLAKPYKRSEDAKPWRWDA